MITLIISFNTTTLIYIVKYRRKKEILLAPLGQTLGRYGFDP